MAAGAVVGTVGGGAGVDLAGGVIHVRVAMSLDTETVPKSKHSIHDVPIAAPLLPVLRRACAVKLPLARVVVNLNGGTPSRTHLLMVFVALQRRLGFAKLWSFHSLRHYFCSTLVPRAVSVAAVQALAGHENIRVTDRYNHATREDLRAGIATFGTA
ncbi:MAG: tyrosine-type recombinase/integrase [Polyangiaceae bacterium]